MSLNKIVSTTATRLDVLLVLQVLGAYKAGIYGLSSTLAVGVPLIIGSFATVLASKFSSITNKKILVKFFYKSIGLSVVFSSFLIIGVIVAPFVMRFFGEKYIDSIPILQWLLIGFIPFALSTPAVNILIYHFKKPHIISYLSIFQLLIIISINYYFLPIFGIYAPVLALSLANLLTFVITYIYSFKYLSEK